MNQSCTTWHTRADSCQATGGAAMATVVAAEAVGVAIEEDQIGVALVVSVSSRAAVWEDRPPNATRESMDRKRVGIQTPLTLKVRAVILRLQTLLRIATILTIDSNRVLISEIMFIITT